VTTPTDRLPELTSEDEWLLSFYRTSEISGALFFGRIARSLKPGPTQRDMTRHFADEAQHARYWTNCIEDLGARALKLDAAYQDQYISAVGLPANLMEVLAITHVFERRVVNQYARHLHVPHLHPAVKETLDRIVGDEKWHIQWVRDALRDMEPEYGKAHIDATLSRMVEADREIYRQTTQDHEERVLHLVERNARWL
jgi:bacterioferritin (cytochrome b1)